MSFLSRLFNSKTTEKVTTEKSQIGIEMPKPNHITNHISIYFKEVPDWIDPASGWGYTKENALVITTDNPELGVHSEYVFAELRSRIEVRDALQAVFDGFQRGIQRLMEYGDSHYDVLSFKVYYFTIEDWEYLKNDFESHNNYENDKAGLEKHNQLRLEKIKYYSSECWINIDSFFGKY